MDRIRELKDQVLKFGTVGIIAFIVDYTILYLLTELFDVYYLISALIAYCISTIINYILSMIWVFNVKQSLSKQNQFIIFVALSIIGLGINEIIMYISVEIINVYYLTGKIIATIIVMFWNFITKKIALEDH